MFKLKENKAVPNVTFNTIKENKWASVTTDEIFKGKTVIVFSLPGAFTPTCSSSHLPRYDELAHVFKEFGVDEIVVVSVNDTFVMNAWEKDQGTQNIRFVPDGNGEFTEKMGLLVDKEDLGFGKRSWRYSMLVRDGIIEKQFIEPNEPGDPFKVSDADTMLTYIAPEYKEQDSISIFTKDGCEHCIKAKSALDEKGLKYENIVLDKNISITSIRAITGRDTVPQVFIGGNHIGGNEELNSFLSK